MHGVTIDTVDQMTENVFGDHIRHNDVLHVDGGIANDTTWQDYWRRLIVFPRSDVQSAQRKRRKAFIIHIIQNPPWASGSNMQQCNIPCLLYGCFAKERRNNQISKRN
jgi:hypothetical protein